MLRLARVVLLVLVFFIVFGCASVSSKSKSKSKSAARAADVEPGFKSIFNGHDLSGWVYGTSDKGETEKKGRGYQVKDGTIYCTKTDGGNLYTDKEYADFVYRLEFRLTPGANNGVGIRAPLQGNTAYQGMEIQVLDDTAPQYAHLRPEQYCGSIYDVAAADRGHLKPVGEWNEEEITADGRHVTVKLNGATVVNKDLDDVTDPAKLAKHPGLKNKAGHLGFLGHGAEVQFRNLRVKELRPGTSPGTASDSSHSS
jgi:hypothetical protein